MSVTALPNPDLDRRKEVAHRLREIADELESGAALHVVGIVDYPGGTYSMFRSRNVSRHEMLGILIEAMVRIGAPPSWSD